MKLYKQMQKPSLPKPPTQPNFDYAFCLRIPKTDLDYVESRLIKALKPKYNISGKTGKLVMPGDGYRIRSTTEYGKEIINSFLKVSNDNSKN